MPTEPLLVVERLSARWGSTPVLRDVSFSVAPGEFLSLLGPNGSGKSTLLRVLAGFESPSGGAVRLGGQDLDGVPPHLRSIGILFQEPALFPRRTVLQNVAYAPLLQHLPEGEVRSLVGRLSGLLGLDRLLDRYPNQLSGGEAQRVALARTLAARPRVVLLDEPFASVDVEVRRQLHATFRSTLRELGTAAVHVTHDREEGLFLGDRVALLFQGSLEAIGTPREVFDRPPSATAAAFLGYNVLEDGTGRIAVLPSDLRVVPEGAAGVRCRVVACGPVGREFLSVVEAGAGQRWEARTPQPLPPGALVTLGWDRATRLPPDPTPG